MVHEIPLTGDKADAVNAPVALVDDAEISWSDIRGIYPADTVVSVDGGGRIQRIIIAPGISVDRNTAIEMKRAGVVSVNQYGWETLNGAYALNFVPGGR